MVVPPLHGDVAEKTHSAGPREQADEGIGLGLVDLGDLAHEHTHGVLNGDLMQGLAACVQDEDTSHEVHLLSTIRVSVILLISTSRNSWCEHDRGVV
jgi:hypothetical protein